MNWRLPQILLAMALILLAGVVSVWYFETRMGGATVPGLVIVEVPAAGEAELTALAEGVEGARLEAVPAAGGPFAPFEAAVLDRLRERGDSLVVYVADAGQAIAEHGGPDGGQRTIEVDPAMTFDLYRRPTGPWSAALDARRDEDPDDVSRCAAYLRAQRSTRAFCVGLVLGDLPDDAAQALREPLLAALGSLPDFRRSSLVLLGARSAANPASRWSLRIDLGRWVDRARPQLADLLEAGW